MVLGGGRKQLIETWFDDAYGKYYLKIDVHDFHVICMQIRIDRP